jgi:SAM-dependent methyltransferase
MRSAGWLRLWLDVPVRARLHGGYGGRQSTHVMYPNPDPDNYTAHYRWEWFRRGQWRPTFRQWKRHSAGAFVELVKQRGLERQPVLDCSSGLGLKTIVMREAGLAVQGSDRCALAVQYARELAAEEGHADLPFFVSVWAELPRKTDTRFAAVFNDALSWVYEDAEMAAGLQGLHDCLRPGGLLAYMGALPGTDHDQAQVLEQEWGRRTAAGVSRPGFHASDGAATAQEVVHFEKGADYIDEHYLITVSENGQQRLESWVMRCAVKWGWPRMEAALRRAGFGAFRTQPFIAANGKPFDLVVAQKK